jgi:hypothetical protein
MLEQIQTLRPQPNQPVRHQVTFTKGELNAILSIYSFQVSKGSWRDYAIDFTKSMAMFSIFRHAHENPLASVVKAPANTASGYVYEVFYDRKRLSRSADLSTVLDALKDCFI